MLVFGFCGVRDEEDLVELVVEYHLAIGVDVVIAFDNGSIDGTWDRLQAARTKNPGQLIARQDFGAYDQRRMFAAAAEIARERGADWLLPFDADEFWSEEAGDLRGLLRDQSSLALRAERVNYVQSRECVSMKGKTIEEALSTMRFRAEPATKEGSMNRELVESGEIGWVEICLPPKHAVRPLNGLEMGHGFHQVFFDGDKTAGMATPRLRVLHAPLYCASRLPQKALHGKRAIETFPDPSVSWHLKRFARLRSAGKLEQEWAANSYAREALDVRGRLRPVVPDTCLLQALDSALG